MDILISIGHYLGDALRDNVVSILIGICLGGIGRTLIKMFRYRHAKHFWRPFVTGDLQVIVGRFFEFASFEQTGFLGVGEAIGLTELRTYFKNLGLSDFNISYADELTGDALKTNLILLGGPDSNSISREMLEKIQTNIRFGNPTIHEITLFDKVNEKYFIPKGKEGSKSIDKDYGGIIKTANPFAQDKQVLIIAGSYGYGTWAGVRFTTSEEFIKNKAVAKNKPIECIIETDIVRRTPQKIQCLFLREINKAPVHHDTSTIH